MPPAGGVFYSSNCVSGTNIQASVASGCPEFAELSVLDSTDYSYVKEEAIIGKVTYNLWAN